MDFLDLNDLQPRDRWVPVGYGIELRVRMAAPGVADAFRAHVIRDGIGRVGRGGEAIINVGRERDYYRVMAEHYVLDWRGNIKPDGTAYSAAHMGEVLRWRPSILRTLLEAMEQEDRFFGSNGGPAT